MKMSKIVCTGSRDGDSAITTGYIMQNTMTPRERELAVIRREPADRAPADVISIEIVGTIAAWLNIEEKDVYDRLGIDGRIVSAGYRGVIREPENGIGFNEWGTPNTGDYGTGHLCPLASANSISDVEHYSWPDINQYDFTGAVSVVQSIGQKYALRGPYWMPVFCRVCDLFGMEEAMMKMCVEPAVFDAAVEKVFEVVYEFCKRLLDACGDGMPILCIGDDFATQRGMMISPEQFRKFIKPRLAKIFALGKERGKLMWFHSCGDITAILPDLIAIGMDVWETVQLHALPVTAEYLKKEYGKDITFFGGINTQRLPYMTPAEVREEVQQCIRVLGKGGGYICGPDHHVKPDVPVENAIALFDAIRDHKG